jgi:hypothetical protein
MFMSNLPLSGIKILDLTRVLAGLAGREQTRRRERNLPIHYFAAASVAFTAYSHPSAAVWAGRPEMTTVRLLRPE